MIQGHIKGEVADLECENYKNVKQTALYCRINSRFTYKRNVRLIELSKAQKAQQFTPLVGDVLVVLKGLLKDIFA